jgi:hypothetical protein
MPDASCYIVTLKNYQVINMLGTVKIMLGPGVYSACSRIECQKQKNVSQEEKAAGA